MSTAHLLLTQAALLARREADELLMASYNARTNAEAMEEIICNGSDEEVKAALHMFHNPAVGKFSSSSMMIPSPPTSHQKGT